jgi:hypothetical protein
MQHEILNEIVEVSGLRLEELAAVAAEFKARVQGKSATGWEAELALCERERVQKLWCDFWREKKREYNRRYKLRRAERLRVMRPIYQARWKAKLLGIPQPPLPKKQQKERKGVEVKFDY